MRVSRFVALWLLVRIVVSKLCLFGFEVFGLFCLFCFIFFGFRVGCFGRLTGLFLVFSCWGLGVGVVLMVFVVGLVGFFFIQLVDVSFFVDIGFAIFVLVSFFCSGCLLGA